MLFRSSEGTLKKIAPKSPKQVAYEAAVKEAQNAPADGATTLKKKAAEKLAAKTTPVVEEKSEVVAEEAVAVTETTATDAPEVEAVVAETPAETPAEAPAAE